MRGKTISLDGAKVFLYLVDTLREGNNALRKKGFMDIHKLSKEDLETIQSALEKIKNEAKSSSDRVSILLIQAQIQAHLNHRERVEQDKLTLARMEEMLIQGV